MDNKTTPTPWRIYKEPMNPNPRIMAEASTLVAVISEGRAFAKPTNENAAFIVRAVNAYEKDQEIKRELLRELKDLLGVLPVHRLNDKSCLKNTDPYCVRCSALRVIAKAESSPWRAEGK